MAAEQAPAPSGLVVFNVTVPDGATAGQTLKSGGPEDRGRHSVVPDGVEPGARAAATAFENNVDGCEPAAKRYKAASDADQHLVGEPTTYQPELHVIDSSGDEPTTKRYKAAAETLPTESNQPEPNDSFPPPRPLA